VILDRSVSVTGVDWFGRSHYVKKRLICSCEAELPSYPTNDLADLLHAEQIKLNSKVSKTVH
jgi:hypothetical protein